LQRKPITWTKYTIKFKDGDNQGYNLTNREVFDAAGSNKEARLELKIPKWRFTVVDDQELLD
jgi:hypothetical protein